MDYDDNDLHSQNFHLAGESSTKFPPVLRPYALPKFDFDDSLQSHLRFDSLVETEVFLGIESNQDNHWIEDFSRGSSGIEFNSSGAEPCSISRRNNVWSEATSSESVEMLLKSVGQEEVIAAPAIVEEADACDELGCLTKQMEQSLKHDENIRSNTDDTTNLEKNLPPDEIVGNSSGLKGDVGVDQSGVEDTAQTKGGEVFVGGSSNANDASADCKKDVLRLNEGIFLDIRGDDMNKERVDDSADKHLYVQMQEDSFASRLQGDNLVASTQNIITKKVESSNKDVQLPASDASGENPEDRVLDKGAEMKNQNVDGNVVHSIRPDEQPVSSAAEVETVSERSVEGSRSDVEEPASNTLKGHSELPLIRGHSGGGFGATDTKKCEDMVMSKGGGDQMKAIICDVPSEALRSDPKIERHAVEDSSISGQVPAPLGPKIDYAEGSSKDGDSESRQQVDSEKLVPNPDAGGSSGDNLIAEIHGTTILSEPTTISEKDKTLGEAAVYVHNQDKSVREKDTSQVLNDCNNMDIDSAGKEVGSSSAQPAATLGNESGVAFVNPILASHESNDGVLFPSKDGVKIGVDQGSQILAVPLAASTQLVEETLTSNFAESNVSSSIVSSPKEAAPGSTSEAKEDAPCDTSAVPLCETADQSLPRGNNYKMETVSKAQLTVEDLGGQSTTEMNMSTGLCESTVKEGEVSEAMVISQRGANIDNIVLTGAAKDSEESHDSTSQKVQEGNGAILVTGDKSSGQAVELSFRNNGGSSADQSLLTRALLDDGSSSVGRRIHTPASEPSQSKNGVKEGVKDSMKQDVLVSKVIDAAAANIEPKSQAPKGKDPSKEIKPGSNDTSSKKLTKGDARKILQSLPAGASLRIAEGSPSSSLPGQLDPKIVQEIPQTSTQVSEVARGRPKDTPERKSRRSSGRASGKDNPKKGAHAKEVTPARQSEKSSNVPVNPSGIFHVMQSNEMQPYGLVDGNNNKPYFVLAASTASLPDLNTSASTGTVFQQPFTDFQQVQLRAQIFVYGALIQGTAPEEAYMLSAFGGPDGGKSMWVNAWQASVERLQNQKSNPSNPETPLHSRQSTSSSARTVDQVGKQSALQSKSTSTPAGRSSTKSSQTVVSPMIPLSSPLWSMPTRVGDAMQSNLMPRGSIIDYQQALTPIHPFQTPPLRNLLGNNTPWMSSFRGPWVASPQPSVPESITRFTTFPPTEVVQLTPVKETSVPQSSSKHVSSGPTVPAGAPASIFTAASPLVDLKKVTPLPGQKSSDPKPRKRKKNSVSEEAGQMILQSQSQAESAPIVSSSMVTPAVMKTPASFACQAISEKLVGYVAPTPLFDPFKKADHDFVQRTILSEESVSKIKEATKQAEDATALATAAVGHREEIWNQLEKQKNSGLVSDVEAKLASAAVAIAAAAAVAQAAAAAANVASNAALQAKLMFEEGFDSNSFAIPSQGNVLETPSSILKGEDRGNSSSSIITAAREAARRKVEAASAASRRAENVDAIVKAAELAAEAVSQAGKIVAMGDPLTLSELIKAGPDGYWRAPLVSPELLEKSTEMNKLSKAGVADSTNSKPAKDGRSGKKGKLTTTSEQPSMSDEHLRLVGGISGSMAAIEKETNGQKGHNVSDLTKNIVVVLESEPMSKSSSLNVESKVENDAAVHKENAITEGSKVEVFKDGDGFKGAWYTAYVLSLSDGKACVAYTEIGQNGGSAQLEEWVPLAGEGDNPPRIRTARPVTAMLYEGTRKRRRAAMGDYNWSVGDRVDAWMTDSWWEGVVTEKNKKDYSAVTVDFPVQVEKSIVKAWHLRPSLIWRNGEWVEWSNLQHDSSLHEGDVPQEKRLKLGSPAVEGKGKDKILKGSDVLDSGKPEESRLLDLSGNDKVFNIGKSSRNDNKPDSTRMVRTGLQKEGSRVVFGVPKPGKKRKFMEVSKHYVADQSHKDNEPSDSIKYLKHSTSQGSGPRGLRNDTKEKRVAESKLRGLKPGKQQTAFGRTVTPRDFSANSVSTSGVGAVAAHAAKVKDSISHADNTSRKQSTTEAGSLSNSEGEGQFVFSASDPLLEGPPSKKIPSTSKTERANKGKLAPAGRKLGKIEEDNVYHTTTVKPTSEAVEPRRSNRRIQPTSRLLEGLQSSLIIPKFPSLSHDRGHRGQSKSTSRGNNHG